MIKEKMKQLIGKSINKYNTQHVKDVVSELKFKEQYQGRIIDCMVGEVDDNYIITPETDSSIVKLEHSKEGVVKIPSIKGKTILVDADGNETDTPAEGCRLVSVGEEDNKLIFLSKNKNFMVNWIRGSISSTNGQDGNGELNIKTDFIPIKRNDIFIKGLYNQVSSFVAFYDKDKNYLKRTSGNTRSSLILRASENPSSGNTDDIPFDCKYIRLTQYVVSGQTATLSEIENNTKQVIMSYENINYIEPKYHKTEILLKEPLREGDYIEGKKIYRNVKQDGLTLIPLEEPIIEELPNPITLQGFDDTTMYIENTITPTVTYGYNALIPYKEEVLNQQQEVETNTLDIEQNIIPYLMDMEFNLMLMEDE